MTLIRQQKSVSSSNTLSNSHKPFGHLHLAHHPLPVTETKYDTDRALTNKR